MFGISQIVAQLKALVQQLREHNNTQQARLLNDVARTELIRGINDYAGSVAADVKRYVEASLSDDSARLAEVTRQLGAVESDLEAAVAAAPQVS